jgi:hypothetical protein
LEVERDRYLRHLTAGAEAMRTAEAREAKPDHLKHEKPKDDNGHGNDPDKHDESNPGKGKK